MCKNHWKLKPFLKEVVATNDSFLTKNTRKMDSNSSVQQLKLVWRRLWPGSSGRTWWRGVFRHTKPLDSIIVTLPRTIYRAMGIARSVSYSPLTFSKKKNYTSIKSCKTSAVSTTVWMVESQLCKMRGTSDMSVKKKKNSWFFQQFVAHRHKSTAVSVLHIVSNK